MCHTDRISSAMYTHVSMLKFAQGSYSIPNRMHKGLLFSCKFASQAGGDAFWSSAKVTFMERTREFIPETKTLRQRQ